jgi:hypothetical protein
VITCIGSLYGKRKARKPAAYNGNVTGSLTIHAG